VYDRQSVLLLMLYYYAKRQTHTQIQSIIRSHAGTHMNNNSAARSINFFLKPNLPAFDSLLYIDIIIKHSSKELSSIESLLTHQLIPHRPLLPHALAASLSPPEHLSSTPPRSLQPRAARSCTSSDGSESPQA
jgi:hypothetical protein